MVAFLKRAALPLVLACFLVRAARADSAKRNPLSNVPVSGTSAEWQRLPRDDGVLGFINDNGSLKAIGSLTGTINPASGPAQQVTGALNLNLAGQRAAQRAHHAAQQPGRGAGGALISDPWTGGRRLAPSVSSLRSSWHRA
jgi:hypothetical protein